MGPLQILKARTQQSSMEMRRASGRGDASSRSWLTSCCSPTTRLISKSRGDGVEAEVTIVADDSLRTPEDLVTMNGQWRASEVDAAGGLVNTCDGCAATAGAALRSLGQCPGRSNPRGKTMAC